MDNQRGARYNHGFQNNQFKPPRQHQQNYKELNLQQLHEFFGDRTDKDIILQVFQGNEFDMGKTIQQLTEITGFNPLKDLEKVIESSPSNNNMNGIHQTDSVQTPDSASLDSGTKTTSEIKSIKSFSFEEKKGDLFASSKSRDALAHCVSRDLRMGKGIAVLFKNQFGGLDELRKQNKSIGQCAVLKRGTRFVYYMITKENYWNKPSYESVRDCLLDMKQHLLKNNVAALNMPRIGCGLDGTLY